MTLYINDYGQRKSNVNVEKSAYGISISGYRQRKSMKIFKKQSNIIPKLMKNCVMDRENISNVSLKAMKSYPMGREKQVQKGGINIKDRISELQNILNKIEHYLAQAPEGSLKFQKRQGMTKSSRAQASLRRLL